MPGAAHETLVALLKEHPAWLDLLLRATGHRPLPQPLMPADAALRMVDPVEVRPDLLLVAGDTGPWVMVEVQLDRDDAKRRRWPLAAALLLNERRAMGDVVVIT